MEDRHREEVLNIVLAELIVARGIKASPEAICFRGAQRPDVLISFRGLRCVIEGKIADITGARAIVQGEAIQRVDSGLAQIAIAVLYGERLRETPFITLPSAMQRARFEFCICTEVGVAEWQRSSIDGILDALRRAHDVLSTDDAVRQAADELSVGLRDVSNVFLTDHAVCDRLVDLLGIGIQEKSDDGDPD